MQKIFCLVSELFEIGTNRKVTIVELLRHTDLLRSCPGSAARAKRRFVPNLDFGIHFRWTQSSPRTGGVLYAEAEYTPTYAKRFAIESSWGAGVK
jgi:hypothetical protein